MSIVQDTHIWQAVLGEIELTVSRGSFVTWFKNTSLLRSDDTLTVIGVPNVFIKQQLERKYADLILETLRKNGIDVENLEYKMSAQSQHVRVSVEETVLQPTGQQQVQPDLRNYDRAQERGKVDRQTAVKLEKFPGVIWSRASPSPKQSVC